jgi:hypothetical protein
LKESIDMKKNWRRAAHSIIWPGILILSLSAASAASPDLSIGIAKCGLIANEYKFRGTDLQQAACLLRRVRQFGNVESKPVVLPTFLRTKIGRAVDHSRSQMRDHLRSLRIDEASVGGSLDQELSHARDNDLTAPSARYFVIHDTSTELKGRTAFPPDMNTADSWNDLNRDSGPDALAHFFVNRRGESIVGHDLSVPWRAVRVEKDENTGGLAQGLFVHVELKQHRLKDPRHPNGYFSKAPQPGFTDAQYGKLALLYLVTATRSGRYLVPGFHAAIDEGISGAHDDPQNFDLRRFDNALSSTSRKIRRLPPAPDA